MRVVHVRVARADFAMSLAEMREWLDRHNCPLVRFESEAVGDTNNVKVQFEADDLAETVPAGFSRLIRQLQTGPPSRREPMAINTRYREQPSRLGENDAKGTAQHEGRGEHAPWFAPAFLQDRRGAFGN
jgi:hypothetical protein